MKILFWLFHIPFLSFLVVPGYFACSLFSPSQREVCLLVFASSFISVIPSICLFFYIFIISVINSVRSSYDLIRVLLMNFFSLFAFAIEPFISFSCTSLVLLLLTEIDSLIYFSFPQFTVALCIFTFLLYSPFATSLSSSCDFILQFFT